MAQTSALFLGSIAAAAQHQINSLVANINLVWGAQSGMNNIRNTLETVRTGIILATGVKDEQWAIQGAPMFGLALQTIKVCIEICFRLDSGVFVKQEDGKLVITQRTANRLWQQRMSALHSALLTCNLFLRLITRITKV